RVPDQVPQPGLAYALSEQSDRRSLQLGKMPIQPAHPARLDAKRGEGAVVVDRQIGEVLGGRRSAVDQECGQAILPRSSRGRRTARRGMEGAKSRTASGVAPSATSWSPSPAPQGRLLGLALIADVVGAGVFALFTAGRFDQTFDGDDL